MSNFVHEELQAHSGRYSSILRIRRERSLKTRLTLSAPTRGYCPAVSLDHCALGFELAVP